MSSCDSSSHDDLERNSKRESGSELSGKNQYKKDKARKKEDKKNKDKKKDKKQKEHKGKRQKCEAVSVQISADNALPDASRLLDASSTYVREELLTFDFESLHNQDVARQSQQSSADPNRVPWTSPLPRAHTLSSDTSRTRLSQVTDVPAAYHTRHFRKISKKLSTDDQLNINSTKERVGSQSHMQVTITPARFASTPRLAQQRHHDKQLHCQQIPRTQSMPISPGNDNLIDDSAHFEHTLRMGLSV